MGLFGTLLNAAGFGGRGPAEGERLYAAIVAYARQPHWYIEGKVPDTAEGRFEMIVVTLAMVLIDLDGRGLNGAGAKLTEHFIADMDGQLREAGVGDVGIGKTVGQMMSMLGGRLGAYRDGLASGDLAPALVRNLYRAVDPGDAPARHSASMLARFHQNLSDIAADDMLGGKLQ